MRLRILLVAAVFLLLAGLSGCGEELPEAVPSATPAPNATKLTTPVHPSPAAVDKLRSDKDRAISAVGPAGLDELVRGNNAFAFDLYHALSDGEGNLFYSPFSISQALAMTSAGARGETLRQMETTLHHRLPQNELHPAFNALDRILAARGRPPWSTPDNEGEAGQYFRLNIANALWGQHGYHFLPAFLDVLAENYGAGMMAVDFTGAPDESRVRINDWVAEETEGKVEDLLPPGMIGRSTRLVLTNAIYFNASWLWQFNQRDTEVRPFHLAGGATVRVPMMTETNGYGYAGGDGYQAVDLPYSWGELSMTILLPDEGTLGEFEDLLDLRLLYQITDSIETDAVTLTMPLFEFKSELSLGDTLAEMGMPDAFDDRAADFSGLTGSRDLWISEVVHQAFVSVDEKGTEAAAATGVNMLLGGFGEDTIVVTVDRPFIFLIRDTGTGTVLFLGRVSNPNPE